MSERFILESSDCSVVVEDQFDISLNLFDENLNSTEYYNMSKCSYPCTPSPIYSDSQSFYSCGYSNLPNQVAANSIDKVPVFELGVLHEQQQAAPAYGQLNMLQSDMNASNSPFDSSGCSSGIGSASSGSEYDEIDDFADIKITTSGPTDICDIEIDSKFPVDHHHHHHHHQHNMSNHVDNYPMVAISGNHLVKDEQYLPGSLEFDDHYHDSNSFSSTNDLSQLEKKYPTTKDCLHIWEFLRDLLRNENYYGQLIKWLDKKRGLFKILQPNKVSNLWGQTKSNKEKMNYPNMARGIRFSRVKSGFFDNVTKEDGFGKKLVYKFSQKAKENCMWLNEIME